MSGVDVRGILESAGADPQAPEGSQAWALAQVDAAVAELIEAVEAVYGSPCYSDNAGDDPCPPDCMSCRIRIALARVQVGQP